MKIFAKGTARGNIYVIMKYFFICILFFIGAFNCLQAQDRLVLRTGQIVEVKVDRITDTHVRYTYPGEISIYERPKTAISYILYADGKREIFDENLRASVNNTTSRPTTGVTTAPASRNRLIEEEDTFWEDVKTTFMESDVRGMTRLQRISVVSNVSYRDAIQQLKQKAADMGGTTVLIMDIPERDDIEVMGIVYRDEIATAPRNANVRSAVPAEPSSNTRRQVITQQMESYNNDSYLIYEDNTRTARPTATPPRANTQPPPRNAAPQPRQSAAVNNEPDAVYLASGRVVRGIIEEYVPDDFVSIRASTGRVYEYSIDDIRRVEFESARTNQRQSAPARPSAAPASRGNARYEDDRYSNTGRSSSRYDDDYYDYYSVSGYKGIVDIGYNLSIGGTGEKGNFEINTSHGYQINEYLFTGAGLGLHIYNARDSAMKNQNTFPHYVSTYRTDSTAWIHAVDSSYMTLPIFLDIRGYLPLQNSNLTPFFMLRFGYAFNLSDGFKGMGIYMNPAIGLKYQMSPMLGLNFSLGYSYQGYGGIPRDGGYGFYYIKDSSNTKYEAKGSGGISLKLGIEF